MQLHKSLIISCLLVCLTSITHSQNTQKLSWPVSLPLKSGSLKIYKPTVESLSGNKLSTRGAISFQGKGSNKIVFGAMWLSTLVDIDRQQRIITCRKATSIRLKLPAEQQNLTDEIKKVVAKKVEKSALTLSLDRIIASLNDPNLAKKSTNEIKNTVPSIIIKYKPAILITLDGKPILVKGATKNTMRVINTPFFIALSLQDKKYYLKSSDGWYTATNILGNWSATEAVPSNIQAEFKSVDKKATATQTAKSTQTSNTQKPEIVVVDKPSELIYFTGQPQYGVISNTSLMDVSNCNQKLFLDINNQAYYVLFSGRWYTAASLDSKWSYLPSTKLPADFKKIPPSSPESSILVHVAGTENANEAIMSSCIPQTTAVKKSVTVKPVTYDGTPKFVKVEGTKILYAKNATTPMLLIDGIYYNCRNAVWYVAKTATSILKIATSIPKAILGIPPSSPVYNVKYVKIYDVTPELVYVGYTPGYVGTYVSNGVIVYGTGYVYTPWYSTIYVPRPSTFGFSFHYNSRTDSWGFSVGAGRPYGCVGFGYSSWGGWYGGGHWGYGGCWGGYGPHGNYYHGGHNVYRGGHNNIYVNNSHHHNDFNNTRINNQRFNQHNSHILTDKSGNVYRRGNNGRWQQHDNNRWRSFNSNETTHFLNHQDRMFQRGEQRQRDFGSWRQENHRSFGRGFGGRRGGFRR